MGGDGEGPKARPSANTTHAFAGEFVVIISPSVRRILRGVGWNDRHAASVMCGDGYTLSVTGYLWEPFEYRYSPLPLEYSDTLLIQIQLLESNQYSLASLFCASHYPAHAEDRCRQAFSPTHTDAVCSEPDFHPGISTDRDMAKDRAIESVIESTSAVQTKCPTLVSLAENKLICVEGGGGHLSQKSSAGPFFVARDEIKRMPLNGGLQREKRRSKAN